MSAQPRTRRCVLTLVVATLLGPWVPARVIAQGPFDDWREPVVIELALTGAVNGERARELRPDRITLRPRDSFELQADPYDQRGRRFPSDRFQVGVELQPECEGRVALSETYSGDLEFTAGSSHGRCRVTVYVPGNLNLEYLLEFDVTGMGTDNYTRRQAEEIVSRLYRAVLRRDVDGESRATAVAEVQAGNLENQVRAITASREFNDLRSRSQPADLLEALYEGLFNRTPDSAGANDYLREISRGRYIETIMSLMQSAEFEASLPAR